MALKYADNIQKTFAVGISIVLNCIISTLFLDVQLHWRALLGVAMVVGSTVWFNRAAEPVYDAKGVAIDMEEGPNRRGTYQEVARTEASEEQET